MDINELIRQNVQEGLAEARTPNETPAPAAAAASPITVNIQGQLVTFRDQADLEAQLNATAAAIRQQAQTPPPAPEPTGGRVTDDNGPAFDNNEYIRLMNEDPRKATNYALSHTLFDGKVDNASEVLRAFMQQASQANKQLAEIQFRAAHSEIPLHNPQVSGTIEQARQMLGLSYDNQSLEAAYAYAVQKGALPDFRQIAAAQAAQNAQQYGQNQPTTQYGQPQPQQFNGQQLYPSYPAQPNYAPSQQGPQTTLTNQNPYLQAPPTSGRSQQFSTPVTLDDLDNMSTDQLASLLGKLQNAGIQG